MSRSRDKALKTAKQARGNGAFLPFRLDVLRSPALASLSPYASKLLLDIASQWSMGKNGDACVAFEKVMRARGWRSKATLYKALKELVASGLIVQTRQGSLHECSLYALGWLAIDECAGKLDVQPTAGPLDRWRDSDKPAKNKSSSTPRVPTVQEKPHLGTPRVPDG
ncbi:hypothetical protein ACFQUU_16420 [Herbaspirillum sp. GCM10030257]|uniref:hypothetical protein n=1 Tax=Herbaspirillum sp. GCM10030257 TaxID=3273393 RepID=UPI0036135C46